MSWYRQGPFPLLYNGKNNYSRQVNAVWDWIDSATGKKQLDYIQQSNQAQIDFNEYLRKGNERALADWHKNVPNREIKYPELSYAGAIYRADTGSARSMYDSDIASANYSGNLAFRLAGLYGIGSRLARWM